MNCPEFENLEINFSGRIIFLDIDGTLTADDNLDFAPQVLETLGRMKENNVIHLCTNSDNEERNCRAEQLLNLAVLNKGVKKPQKKIIDGLDLAGRELMVIGDKFLTDGLFAKNIGARFLMVKRKKSGREKIRVKLINAIDDLINNFLTLL